MDNQSSTTSTLPEGQADFDKWIEQGTVKSTRRTYDRDIKYFWSWLAKHLSLKESYPVTPGVVIQFCLYYLNEDSPRRLKVSTLRRYLASVSMAAITRDIIDKMPRSVIKHLSVYVTVHNYSWHFVQVDVASTKLKQKNQLILAGLFITMKHLLPSNYL